MWHHSKGPAWVLGTMSGTSLDGVDGAMILTDGEGVFGFGPSAYRPYTADEAAILRAALGAWPEEPRATAARDLVEAAHLALMAGFSGAVLAGFHGQTLAHAPGGRGTHQAGRGAVIAAGLGLPVAWDFRSADVAAGGQGAPLAPFYHHALARMLGADQPLVFLNLGGVGNLTLVDPRLTDPAAPGACLAFDTGPANAPINDLLRARRGLDYDRDGALAAMGRADTALLANFLAHPYFAAPPPKSLDRDAFAPLLAGVAGLGDADAAATLTEACAQAVARAWRLLPLAPAQVLVCGGGRRNPVLMAALARLLPCPVQSVEAAGLDGDMLEAQAFAYLAARVARGLALSAPGTTGVSAPLAGGQIAHP